ncbi:hypothetical protein AB6A40_001167 [Gnathostoma spinigerum]|uniref:DM domain-containing protein n=1 Tax=Gnathostoma spinigerum TaxID=75299 RepID=A0ABD6ECC7_9BILA
MMGLETFNTIAALNAAAASAAAVDKIGSKRVYYCQRCLNHGRLEPRKNHKCECIFASCTCSKCILVEKRRVLNTQLHELEDVGEGETEEDSEERTVTGSIRVKGERVPNCQKCGQHGRKSRLKGHKRVCPYRDCSCAKCQVVSERQKLMADQIKIRRRQRKDTLMNMTRENITATLNAAAVVAAGGPLPYFSNFNNLIYNQLQGSIYPTQNFLSSSSSGCATLDPSTIPLANAGSIKFMPPTSALPAPPPSQVTATATAEHLKSHIASPPIPLSPPQRPLLFSTNVTVSPNVICSTISPQTVPSGESKIVAPIAINPTLRGRSSSSSSSASDSSKSSFSNLFNPNPNVGPLSLKLPTSSLSPVISNEQLLKSFLMNVRLLEQSMCSEASRPETSSSSFIDVCNV